VQGWSASPTDGSLKGQQLLALSKGARVKVLWRQSEQEGGYWAYGDCIGQLGYFPVSCITSADDLAAGGLYVPPGLRQDGSVALVDVAPASPTGGHQALNDQVARRSFMSANSACRLTSAPRAQSLEEAVVEGKVQPPGTWRSPAQPLAQQIVQGYSEDMAAHHHMLAMGGPVGPPLEYLQRAAAMASAQAAHAAAVNATAYMEASRAAAATLMEIHPVVWPWRPTGRNLEGQLTLREGERVHVRWRQPEDQGAFWAYGALEVQPSRLGYFPISCIAGARGSNVIPL